MCPPLLLPRGLGVGCQRRVPVGAAGRVGARVGARAARLCGMQSITYARDALAAARVNAALAPDPLPDLSALLTDGALVAAEFLPRMDKRFLGAPAALSRRGPARVAQCRAARGRGAARRPRAMLQYRCRVMCAAVRGAQRR